MSAAQAIERYADLSKTELLERLGGMSSRASNAIKKHRELIKHVGFTMLGQGAAATTGFSYGAIERKAPKLLFIGASKVPTASVAGLAISLVNCAEVLGDATPIAQSVADVATGLGARELALRLIK